MGAPACSPPPSTLVSTPAQELDPLLTQASRVRRPNLWSCLLFQGNFRSNSRWGSCSKGGGGRELNNLCLTLGWLQGYRGEPKGYSSCPPEVYVLVRFKQELSSFDERLNVPSLVDDTGKEHTG